MSKDGEDDPTARRDSPNLRRSKSSGSFGSVRFSEPLNDRDNLEGKYELLMGRSSVETADNAVEEAAEIAVPSQSSDAVSVLEQEVSSVVENIITGLNEVEEAEQPSTNRVSFGDQSENEGNFRKSIEVVDQPSYKEAETNADFVPTELVAEDIFDEIKVAHVEKAENQGAQNLHSFIISKTYSSENVVVLLNLRRMNDGEWVLDKTIAQGLKAETYGGLVSIDEYGFSTNPSTNQVPTPAPDPMPTSTVTPPSINAPIDEATNTYTEPESTENIGDIMEILKKMEEYVANVNKQIEAARKAAKNPPACAESSSKPSNPYDDLSYGDQLMKMFAFLVSQDIDTWNLCDDNCGECVRFEDNTETAITYWLRSLIDAVTSLCGWKFPFLWLIPSLNENIASAAQLLSQSRALLEQANQSGIVIQLAAKASMFPNFLPSPPTVSEGEIAVEAKEEKLNLAAAATLELNIESKSNMDEFF
ncbi:unnamed protein product [Orchesella dallaii]|uniref:Uncharacterized protein n=1 Tax=Orchesella dallaii TaxID=48710 RepID=A0ABP1RX84_9HEXA